MADGGILVTFQALEEAVTDTNSVSGQIDSQLSDLKAYLAPMVSSWTGSASDDYKALQQKWDQSATDLNAVLREIAQSLQQAAQNYQQAENSNTSIWA